jgi:hypothetical protein
MLPHALIVNPRAMRFRSGGVTVRHAVVKSGVRYLSELNPPARGLKVRT